MNAVQNTLAERESLEMAQHKIARILNGNPEHVDSWHDVGGYVALVEERLVKGAAHTTL